MFPVLFRIGPVPVYTYGFMVSMGFVLGYFLLTHYWAEEGLDEDDAVNLYLILVVGSIVGARLTYVLSYPQFFGDPWDIVRIWKGGLTIMGGAFLSFLMFVAYCRRNSLKTALILDLFSPCIFLGLIVGRLGCFGYGCCFGKPTELPWGLIFAGTDPLNPPVPRHPTQIYTSLIMVVLFLLIRAYRNRPHPDGMVAVVFVYLYSLYRFVIEFIRDDVSSEHYLFGLTLAQSMSIVAVAVALVIHLGVLRHRPPDRPLPKVAA